MNDIAQVSEATLYERGSKSGLGEFEFLHDDQTVARRSVYVATKNEQECTMTAAVADIRRQTKSLVQRAEIRRQSKMLAYDEIGSQIGTSGMWVRGFVKGYDRYSLNHIVALNIQALYQKYEAVCSVIEADTENMRRERTNAVAKSNTGEPSGEVLPTSRFLPPLEL